MKERCKNRSFVFCPWPLRWKETLNTEHTGERTQNLTFAFLSLFSVAFFSSAELRNFCICLLPRSSWYLQQEVAVPKNVFWECLWMKGLLYFYWSHWIRHCQSNKTIFALKGASIYDVRTEGGEVPSKADIVSKLSKGGCMNLRTRGEVVKKSEHFADVIYGSPLAM